MGQMGKNTRHIAKEGVASQTDALDWHRARSAGHIVDFIVNYQTGNTSVIIEIYPKFVDAVRQGKMSKYVSPMISNFEQDENGELVSGEIVHIHSVDWPGYEPEVAQFQGICTGELSSCKANLMTVAATGPTRPSEMMAQIAHKIDHLKTIAAAGCQCTTVAAGRKYDEDKHKRDEKGQYAKKDAHDKYAQEHLLDEKGKFKRSERGGIIQVKPAERYGHFGNAWPPVYHDAADWLDDERKWRRLRTHDVDRKYFANTFPEVKEGKGGVDDINFSKHFSEKVLAKMTPDERKFTESYIHGHPVPDGEAAGYAAIEKWNKIMAKYKKARVNNMKKFNQENKEYFEKKKVVFRGMKDDNFESFVKGLTTGHDHPYKGSDYVSTSLDATVANEFAYHTGVTVGFDVSELDPEDMHVVEYQYRPDMLHTPDAAVGKHVKGEAWRHDRTDEKFGGTLYSGFKSQREVQIKRGVKPRVIGVRVNHQNRDAVFENIGKLEDALGYDVAIVGANWWRGPTRGYRNAFDSDTESVRAKVNRLKKNRHVSATGVRAVDHLLALLSNFGAAGRKYDENKHKRDAIGQYAKKEGEGARPADDDNPYQFDMENFKKLIDYDDIETTHNFERRVREFEASIHDILYTNESTPVNLVLFQNPEAYTSLGVTRGDLQNVFGGNDMHVWNGEPQLLAIIRDEKDILLEHFPQLERYVQLYDEVQKAMDIGYDRRFNDTDALYRGTDINELDTILRAGMGSGGGFPYANFSIYHEQATEFSLQQDDPIIIKLPKEENREHIVSPGYVLDQSGDNHEGDIVGPQGYDYFYEHEHRIRTDKDVNLGIEVLLRNYGGAEDEFRERMEKRYPFVKKFHYGEWHDWMS